jgi:hypothetical protein
VAKKEYSCRLNTTSAKKKRLVITVEQNFYVTEQHELRYDRFEVFTAVTVKNAVFWGVMPCGSCRN